MTNGSHPAVLTDTELDANLKGLRQDVWRARACWEAWWSMKAKPYRSKYNEVFSEYSGYFAVAIHSHFSALVLALWRLHDPGSTAISLQTLPRRIGLRADIPRETLMQYRTRLRSVRDIVAGLQTIRHKFFAHRDPGYSVERAFKEAKLKYGDLRKVVDVSVGLLNTLLDARRLGTLDFDRPVAGDTVRVIRHLHNRTPSTSNE